LFASANSIWIPWVEEQGLELRFGDAYRAYRINVPAVIPRLRPWTAAAQSSAHKKS
jgi:protein-S-isoprenylcysteine O-methyltransferase Ste14